ncbi:DUF2442 domain-containing protein [Citrobacter tructae]|uniref:DUF2442 domain-containing protein n=1 Tax=Citrobacter tructae TaxID=2562449 RepID=UPI003F553319
MVSVKVTIKQVWIADAMLWLELTDGRALGTPLTLYPRLLKANKTERENCTLLDDLIRWESVGLELSLRDLFSLTVSARPAASK